VLQLGTYESIYIKGISLGGNLVLKYLGEGNDIPSEVKGVVAVSVPCDLKASCDELHKLKNKAYSIRFLDHLKKKLIPKLTQFPDRLTKADFDSIKLLIDFDDVYTSRAHGFKDALDYYTKCSSLQFLNDIGVPALIINALNDSFLSHNCYPVKQAKQNPNLYLEMPKYGGHVGFVSSGTFYFNELRALDFLENL
jgi:predicted alpha/beta-fold hydrolase